MTSKISGGVTISGNSGAVTLGNVSSAMAVGTGAVAVNGGVSPEVAALLNRGVDGLVQSLADLAYQQKLGQRQVELLAADIARINKAVSAPEPDQASFQSAAGDLWNKLMMVGSTVQNVEGLATGLKFIAGALGWSLMLPGL